MELEVVVLGDECILRPGQELQDLLLAQRHPTGFEL